MVQKIAILGGGCGAMAAAFWITAREGWQTDYEVTVYQVGWRLGGKGASGRGIDNRIEEHGLHLWGGSPVCEGSPGSSGSRGSVMGHGTHLPSTCSVAQKLSVAVNA